MERNLLFQPRSLQVPSEMYAKKVTLGKFSPTKVLSSPSDLHHTEKLGHYTERIDRKEGIMNDLLIELSNNLKSKGIGDERIQRLLRDRRKKRKEVIVDEHFDEIFQLKNSKLNSKPSESHLHTRTKSTGTSAQTVSKKNKSFIQEKAKQKLSRDRSPELSFTPNAKLNSSEYVKKSERTPKATKLVHSSKKKEQILKKDLENQIKEEELKRREKQFEDSKEAWERTLTSRLLELKKSEAEVLRQRQEITIEFRKLTVLKDDMEQRSREILIKEEKLKIEASLQKSRNDISQSERYRMSVEDLHSCAMRLESFESWLILREKELEEVNGMLLNERADLEKTEEFFEELDNNLQSKNLKLQNESQAIETAWHELEIERQRLHKWSLQLQNLGNQLKLKEHQLDCSIGALTERRKALKQYQKALEIRERTAMPSEYSPMNKLSRGVKYPYIESDSKDSELEMMESRIEFMESELSGEVISVLTPRSSVSSVAL